MADRATADRVATDMKPPNYRQAIQRLRTIKPKKEKVASINGEIGGIFDTMEGFKVNKKAAKIFLALDPLEPAEQQDIFRSLQGLIAAADWGVGDLVDQAEGATDGNIVTPNFGRRKAAEGDDAERSEGDAIEEAVRAIETPAAEGVVDDEPQSKKKRPSPAEAAARAKEHFANGKAPPAKDDGEPYTGDNSDLAAE